MKLEEMIVALRCCLFVLKETFGLTKSFEAHEAGEAESRA